MSSLETKSPKPSFWLSASKDQAKDTGLALVLVCCIVFLVTKDQRLILLATGLQLLNMIAPALFKPLAKLWFGLSHVLGTVMSKVMLTLVFFLVVTPMGLSRRLVGKDTLQLRRFGRDRTSVFRDRDHLFTSADIEQPF
ncbi:MAG: SxtJ family membrane protein [Desulfovibrionaceae bacterium]|jgi:hypothetical protein